MKAYASTSLGVVVGLNDAGMSFIQSATSDYPWNSSQVPHLLSHVDDWEEIDWKDSEASVATLAARYRTERFQSLSVALLEGVSDDLEEETIQHLEELLQVGASHEKALGGLLIAPLRETWRVTRLAKTALSLNCAATAHLFNELERLQPLLLRFTSLWLSLPPRNFTEFSYDRAGIWRTLAADCLNLKLLECKSASEFKRHWQSLVFKESRPLARSGIIALGGHIADALFPSTLVAVEERKENSNSAPDDDGLSQAGRMKYVRPISNAPADEKRGRALKQVENISQAVAKGDDARAQRYLRELIESQKKEGTEHAVKSLCNIAKRCGDMFRADFERQCLEQALQLKPDDTWTLIQWGDHLKRTGQYESAIKAFQEASVYGEPIVATTAIADVWRQKKNYSKALEIYHSIPDWEGNILIRMATSDILRFQGDFRGAAIEYEKILAEWPLEPRAKIGMAEVYKRQGSLDMALNLYDEVLSMPLSDERMALICRSARCHILKLSGKLSEALQSAEHLVSVAPFHMEARLQRASILALLGKAQQGLIDIPEAAPQAFDEWRQNYMRGLLLFKLSRFAEARKILFERLNGSWNIQGESHYQLVAAYAYLQADGENLDKAQEILIGINNLSDVHFEHIRLVLKLHVATALKDQAQAQAIRKSLSNEARSNKTLREVVVALTGRNFKKALTLELEMLLNAA